MNAAIAVVPGEMADLDAVMTIMTDAFDPNFGEAWTGPQCAGLLGMPGVWLSLARTDTGESAGFALSRTVAGEAELLLLAVSRPWRHKGVGQALLDDFLTTAAARGAERFYLEVRDGNLAVSLYVSNGFSEAGRRRNYYTGRDGQIYDAVTMVRNLKG